MNFYQPIKESRLYPVLKLESWFSRPHRLLLIRVAWLLLAALFVLSLGSAGAEVWRRWLPQFLGAFLLVLAALIFMELVEFYFRSYYFGSIITNRYRASDKFTFTLGRILYLGRDGDWLRAFLSSATGREIMRRLGVEAVALADFLRDRRPRPRSLPLPAGDVWRLRDLAAFLWETEPEFADFLTRFGLIREDFFGAVGWAVRSVERRAFRERWWSYDNLARIPGLAKDWSYGGVYTLEKYSRDLLLDPAARPGAIEAGSRHEEVTQLETILLRGRESNALLVGDPGQGKLETLWQLARLIRSGRVAPPLEDKRLILFNPSLLFASFKDRNAFEKEFLKCLGEARRAGNIILVIDNLAGLLLEAERLGADPAALLDPFLDSNLPVIALVDTEQYHRELGGRPALTRRFEPVWIKEKDVEEILGLLLDAAEELEIRYRIVFTYPALAALSRGAGTYFQSESPTDKAFDLLTEIIPWARAERLPVISRDAAENFIKEKTGIPLGRINPQEKEILLNLEQEIGSRVIGQRGAIRALSQAIRRSRTGIRNPKRPIGSFLFLGPTGVGKTETAKALAATFFGSEETMLRLDMSEFQADDALPRLIGSFAANEPGILANLLRQRPYGVLLLDEFEKTHPQVRDLFLQILDEGFFSDMRGKRVNARNLIIIATSNAGAELIWQMVGAGENPALAKDKFIDHLVTTARFKPELLNRFDEIVIYHPLGPAELQAVARLQLERLGKRLSDQGLTLVITEELAVKVAAGGYNPLFGARPMLRYIQAELEERVATGLIRGDIKSGDKIKFDSALNLVRLP